MTPPTLPPGGEDDALARGPFELSAAAGVPGLARFACEAMATTWEIIIAGEDPQLAAQAARAAFAELERLERDLSRFVETSDIAQLNALAPGQWLPIGDDTMECLLLAAAAHAWTGGAFDVTIGPLLARWQAVEAGSAAPPSPEELEALRARVGTRLLALDPERHLAGVLAPGVSVDLGAIGKGYAADCLAGLLREWGIGVALVHGGTSSIVAWGAPPGTDGWRLALRDPRARARVLGELTVGEAAGALGGSGALMHGRHIIDPRTGLPAAARPGAWASAPLASLADAYSTAFMIMSEGEVAACCAEHPELGALLAVEPDEPGVGAVGEPRASGANLENHAPLVLRAFGAWPAAPH